MKSFSNLPEKFLRLANQSGKYVVGGLLNTLVTYAIYLFSLELLHRSIAFATAFSIGVFFSYNWNRAVVFADASRRGKFIRFLPIPVAQLSAALLIIEGAVTMGVREDFAGLASIAILTPVSFILTRSLLDRTQRPIS